MLDEYLKMWKSTQNMILANVKDLDSICDYHDAIMRVMHYSISKGINIIELGERMDPNWEFEMSVPKDWDQASNIVYIGKTIKLPINKLYGNSHKP